MEELLLILVAPNVSEQMGGEGVKALQIFEEMTKLGVDTVQITHARNRAEVARLGLANVEFVEDDALALFIWRSVVLRSLLDVWFSRKAVRMADRIGVARGKGRHVVVHQTEPNSPVTPRSLSPRFVNVFGPVNGNIYYPDLFRDDERLAARLRRMFHMPMQRLNRLLPGGIKHAQQILVAGGTRTDVSLRLAGCPVGVMRPTLDCGIRDLLLDRPRVEHTGTNFRFLHFGRLVFHKGTALIIRSLPRTLLPVTLDIVGRGPELERCKALVDKLGLQGRVRFLDWYEKQSDLFSSFDNYRAVVLPSLEDANGIVIQEAMSLGLPPVCLDWGGPALLIEHGKSGFLVEPLSIDHITGRIAAYLDELAANPELAESISIAARRSAGAWRWSTLAKQWLTSYPATGRS